MIITALLVRIIQECNIKINYQGRYLLRNIQYRPIQTNTSHLSWLPCLQIGPVRGAQKGNKIRFIPSKNLMFLLSLIIMQICRRHGKLNIFAGTSGKVLKYFATLINPQ